MSGLGALLRRFREESGLTQEELAERAGVSARTVSDTERGLRSRLYADTAGRLAEGLGLDDVSRAAFVAVARGRDRAGTIDAEAVYGVPHPLTALVGRQDELRSLLQDLQPGGRRLVTITGLGGSGKTRLATAAALELTSAFEGRVRLVRFTPDADPARFADSVAAALGTAPLGVAVGVAGRPTLLVLDAFEHAFASTAALAELLERAPELQALVTSRERLRVAGEREVALGPLAADAASTLFLDRVRDLTSSPTDQPEVVAEICRLVSGLPLPLELAAAHVRYLPLHLLRDRLRDGLTDAHHVVQEAVAWSVSSLDSHAQSILSAAAMFPAGWDQHGLEAVTGRGDVIETLAALTDRGLVWLDETTATPSPRWRMLDVVRETVAGREPWRRDRRAAFAQHHLDLLDDTSESVGQERSWYQVLATEEPNVRSALTWAEDNHEATTLLALATRMWLFWQARGGLDEGRRWLSSGLTMRPPAPPALQATAWWAVGWLAYHQADDEAAEAAGRELARLADEQGDPATRRNALTIAGMVEIARDRPAEAVQALTGALAVARELDQPWILATSLLNLGLGHLASNEPQSARAALGQALAAYGEIGDRRFQARCTGYLGLTSLLEGDPARADVLFAQSLRVFADLAEPAGVAEGLAGAASAAAAAGRAERAAKLGGAAERLRETIAARELPLERRVTARHFASAEQQLGAETWRRFWHSGRALTVEQAVAEALTA